MACGSPECARAISGRGTSLTPGPESLPSTGANHGGRLSTGTRLKWGGTAGVSCRCAAAGEVEGCATGDCSGMLWEEGCRMAVRRATQAKYRACARGGLKGNEGEAPF